MALPHPEDALRALGGTRFDVVVGGQEAGPGAAWLEEAERGGLLRGARAVRVAPARNQVLAGDPEVEEVLRNLEAELVRIQESVQQRSAPGRPGGHGGEADALGSLVSATLAGIGHLQDELVDALESTSEALLSVSRDGVVSYANAQAERTLGRSRSELLGRPVRLVFPFPDDVTAREVERTLLTHASIHREVMIPALRGWFELRVFPSARGLSMYFRDVSDRHRMIEALERTSERLQLALDVSEMGTWELEVESGKLSLSSRAADLLGASRSEAGRPVAAVLQTVAAADRPIAEHLWSGEPGAEVCQFRVERPHEQPRWLEGRGRRCTPPGRPARVLGTLVDATDRMRAARELQQVSDFGEQLMGMVSQDLRTPLATIHNSARLLQTRVADRERAACERILRSVRTADALTHVLLDYTQARVGGGIPIHREPVDPHALLRLIVEEQELAHPDRSAQVETRGSGVLLADPDRLAQAVGHLMANAFRHTPPGGTIEVRSELSDAELTVLVRNPGPGIPAELLPHLFEPFRRAEQVDRPRDARGLGLGLFIVDHIARGHGGRVSARSAPGGLTELELVLPRG